ncbi:choline-sulfatase [Primorskyibacter sedentarius]|uniref:Choline-sulfatase n=1 Tax=Primorskyibacter sedentarius TaxID=745311 RepID=A0A4R3JCW7_9RHOB|nr:sulfatase-like hydrolase/transferase [Primorskyibacter sedentarius]TCS63235.1 choline-sulfatase [Primorskyibacter sedentarius]
MTGSEMRTPRSSTRTPRRGRKNKRPNILYIMSDQHARRVAGCYGDSVAQTPNIDRLAARGVCFDTTYCPSPICVPSRMSAFTGQHPHEQRCWTLQDHLSSDRPTWMHALGAAGYRPTLAGRMHAVGPDQMHGFVERLGGDAGPNWPGVPAQSLGPLAWAQGPGPTSLKRSGTGRSGYQTVDEETAAIACDWLASKGAETTKESDPFCLMVGFLLPHCPFVADPADYAVFDGKVPPPSLPMADPEHPWLVRWRRDCGVGKADVDDMMRARTAYYALVMRMDRLIGTVLDALERAGLDDNTLIIYCSDHGEQIGEHGHWWKNTFYEDSVAVPLIMSWPGRLPQGVRRAQVTNLIDVGATLIDAAGAPPLPASHGRSLLKLCKTPVPRWENVTFSEYVTDTTANWCGSEPTRQRMIRKGRYKLIYIDGYEPLLFDLETDPGETCDLAADPDLADIRSQLTAEVLETWDPTRIAQDVRNREREKAILHEWASQTRPEQQYVRRLEPSESWLEPPSSGIAARKQK